MSDDEYTQPSVGDIDATPLTGPPTKDGCLYLALRLQRLGVKDRLKSIHQTPEDAYQKIVRHVGHPPDDYTPDFPDGDWGEEIWGWHTDTGATYVIQQYRWSGADSTERSDFPTDKPDLG